jgi:hypothetical protein
LDRASGLSALGFFDSFAGSAPAFAFETSSMRVPLSRCTFFPAEVINELCVLLTAVDVKLSPFKPNTPSLLDVICPAEFKPPMAPLDAPATLPVAFPAEFRAPPAVPPTPAAVFVMEPAAPPAVEATPPSAPRPPDIPEPAADAPMPPAESKSDPAAAVFVCAEAIA